MKADPLGARKGAVRLILAALERGEMLDEAALPDGLPGPDRARALSLARATMRWLGPADAVLARFLKRPPDAPARAILRLGAVEMLALDAAPHGVVDACVEMAKARRETAKLSGLVNAVLRKVADQGAEIWDGLDYARLAAPDWFWRQLRADWGKDAARAIVTEELNAPPLDLTVRADAAGWAQRLGGKVTPNGSVRLMRPGRITELEGYVTGDWWAQDAAAATAARLAGAGEGRRALDLCAAPGGKTMQLAAAGWAVTALDASASRMERIKENLARTNLSAELVTADALEWKVDQPFDLVLLDAPCTSTGTVRRHPELPHIRDGGGADAAAVLQSRLMAAAWTMVAPGGRMIYATCSLNRAEGEAQAASFLAAHPEAERIPVTPEEVGGEALITRQGDYRARPDLWAQIGGMDGFFACRIGKPS